MPPDMSRDSGTPAFQDAPSQADASQDAPSLDAPQDAPSQADAPQDAGMLWLSDADVERLLSVEDAIPVIEAALAQQAAGGVVNRPRAHDIASEGAFLAHMQAALYEQGVFGFKSYSAAGGVYRFFVALYSMETGLPLALMAANSLGRIRTGAASGVSARHMARRDASAVGILGSGYQAGAQLQAICAVRPIKAAYVFSPNADRRNEFARRMTAELGIETIAVDNPRQVVDAADILVTITNSREPVFGGEWLRHGMHICAVGGANEYATELDDDAIRRADIIAVDSIAQAKIECGELLMPASRGVILWEQLTELCQIVSGEKPGRRSPEDITLFKSLGMAMWDVAAAKAAYDSAIARGVGVRIGAGDVSVSLPVAPAAVP